MKCAGLSAVVMLLACGHGAMAESEPEDSPSAGSASAAVASEALVPGGPAVRVRTDTEDAVSMRLLTGAIDGEEHVLVAADARVLLSVRRRDFLTLQRISGHYGQDYLMLVTEAGGPGTCIWERSADVYRLVEMGPDQAELTAIHHVPFGGYLDCADGQPRACGCGTWDTGWATRTEEHRTLLITTPRVAETSTSARPAEPPPGVTLSL